MTHEYIFVALSFAASIVRYSTYCLSIYRKQTRPHFFSWFVWGLMVGIGAYAQFQLHGGPSVWGLMMVTFNCVSISIWSLWVGEKNITRSDWFAFVVALLTIGLWALTKSAMTAIVLLLVFDVFSYWPTLRKCWLDPWSEPPASIFWSGLRYFFLLFAVPNPTYSSLLYPFWLMAADWTFMGYVIARRRALSPKTVLLS